MPTVLRIGGHRFFFYANEATEPVHVHIQSGEKSARFWLNPLVLARSAGYDGPQLLPLHRHVEQPHDLLERTWHEFFHRYETRDEPDCCGSMVRRGAALGSSR